MAPTTARSKGPIPAALSTGRNRQLQPISINSLRAHPQMQRRNSPGQILILHLLKADFAAFLPTILSDQEIAKPNPANTDKHSATR